MKLHHNNTIDETRRWGSHVRSVWRWRSRTRSIYTANNGCNRPHRRQLSVATVFQNEEATQGEEGNHFQEATDREPDMASLLDARDYTGAITLIDFERKIFMDKS